MRTYIRSVRVIEVDANQIEHMAEMLKEAAHTGRAFAQIGDREYLEIVKVEQRKPLESERIHKLA